MCVCVCVCACVCVCVCVCMLTAQMRSYVSWRFLCCCCSCFVKDYLAQSITDFQLHILSRQMKGQEHRVSSSHGGWCRNCVNGWKQLVTRVCVSWRDNMVNNWCMICCLLFYVMLYQLIFPVRCGCEITLTHDCCPVTPTVLMLTYQIPWLCQ